MDESVEELRELMTLDELCNRVGMSVRNVRFYTSRGLVPPPIRRGRSGYYSPEHLVRLELVQELQAHGFTLSAIEKYVAAIPDEASAADIAVHRTMLAPWMADVYETLTPAELEERAGRKLSSRDLEALALMRVVIPGPGSSYNVVSAHLSVAIAMVDLEYPLEALEATTKVFEQHGRAIAEDLTEVFRTMVWPTYKERGVAPEQLQAVVERLKPLSIAGLVSAYELAVDEMKRESIARRAR